MKQVESLALESQGYQVEKENKAFEQIKDSAVTFQTFPDHLPRRWKRRTKNEGFIPTVTRHGRR